MPPHSPTDWLEETFCSGDSLWNTTQLWNTSLPIVSRCLRKTVPIWAPAALLWLCAPIQVYLLWLVQRNNRQHPIPLNGYNITRMCLVALLIALSLAHLAYDGIKSLDDEITATATAAGGHSNLIADLSSSLINVFTYTLFFFLINLHRLAGHHTSALAWFYTFFQVLFSLPNTYMLSMFFWSRDNFNANFLPPEAVLYLTEHLLNLLVFILTCFADTKKPVIEDESLEPYPEQTASFISKHTYWWFNPLAQLGFKKTLLQEDIWDCLPSAKVTHLTAAFERNWQVEVDRLPPGKSPGVLTVLIRTFGPSYLHASFFQLVNVCLLFVAPQLLKQLIGFISSPNAPRWHGILLAISLFSVFTVNSLIFVYFIRQILVIGTQVKNTLVSVIYKKSLTLSSAARRHATTGQIVNLMSTDAKQFLWAVLQLDDAWAAPLQVLISIFFLWNELGVSAFAGIGAMITLLPLNWWITKAEQRAVKKQMTIKDERVNVTSEVLAAIRVVKLYGWEVPFIQKLSNIRLSETQQLRKIALLNALTSFIWECAPFVVSFVTFSVYVLSSTSHVLDAKKAFISLSLFELMRYPLGAIPNVINKLVITVTSLRRLNRYFAAADLERYVSRDVGDDDQLAVVLENATFSWGEAEPAVLPDDEEETKKEETTEEQLLDAKAAPQLNLTSINLSIKRGSLVAIVGPVGCGKSSLISAILGEMELKSGRVAIAADIASSISYVAQQAWIQNASLRDNVLFGSAFDEDKYNRVLQMSALLPDIAMLPGGDLTEIGEKGINLSGGQKQRVALARAAYNAGDLVLLDDPLSAVDSHVTKHLFSQLLSSSTGYLKDKTRILVTNNIAILPEVDQIVVLAKGQVSEIGLYDELLGNSGKFADFLKEHSTSGAGQNGGDNGEDAEKKKAEEDGEKEPAVKASDKLIEEEKAEEGRVKWSVYFNYFRSLNYFYLAAILFFFAARQTTNVFNDLWLAVWSNDPPATPNTTDASIALRNKRLLVYGALGFGQNILYLIGWIALAIGSVNSSITLHRQLLERIMKSPMAFFDTTPQGRIVNRFSKDMNTVDSDIRSNVEGWFVCCFQMIALIILIIIQIPLLSIVVLLILILYYFIQRYYIAAYRQLSRLESVTSSPIFSHFGESLAGMSTIRAFAHQSRFIRESTRRVDTNQRMYWAMVMANRWLGVRMELCGNLVVLFAATFAVLEKESFQDRPGFVGLIVTYAVTITVALKWLVRFACMLETSVVAVERIGEYCELPSEGAWTRKTNVNPTLGRDWPGKGEIQVEGYSVRYRPGLEPVLKNINLDIKAGEKVGVVGRTGSGKSTLTLALFRILEADQGRITIDGVDISRIGLHELRSKLSIIPQDPVLFSGTIRTNLDPLGVNSDERLWQTLEHCHLKAMVSELTSGLDAPVAENGSNLSVGERQLICLGRALLRETRILVLDEATSAVDLDTDALIQETINNHFAECTVITIAHRLQTVRQADRVLALEQGTIAEFDSPDALLAKPESIFYSLAKDAGLGF